MSRGYISVEVLRDEPTAKEFHIYIASRFPADKIRDAILTALMEYIDPVDEPEELYMGTTD